MAEIEPHQHHTHNHVFEQLSSRQEQCNTYSALGLPIQAKLVRTVQCTPAAQANVEAIHWLQTAHTKSVRQSSGLHADAAASEMFNTNAHCASTQMGRACTKHTTTNLAEGGWASTVTLHIVRWVQRTAHTQEPLAQPHLSWYQSGGG